MSTLSLSNAALLVCAVITTLTRRGEGGRGIGEEEIIEGGIQEERACRGYSLLLTEESFRFPTCSCIVRLFFTFLDFCHSMYFSRDLFARVAKL